MAKVAISPVGKRIVVTPEAVEEKTKSGIILTGTSAKEKPERGTVVAVGEKLDGVNVGDTVAFAKYTAEEVKVGEQVYYVVKHEDVVAVIN
jgi:chaperonin GroES